MVLWTQKNISCFVSPIIFLSNEIFLCLNSCHKRLHELNAANHSGLKWNIALIVLSILYKNTPLRSKTVTIKNQPLWYSAEIHSTGKDKRKAERKWRWTGLTVHKEIYCEKWNLVSHVIAQAKNDYYKTKLGE